MYHIIYHILATMAISHLVQFTPSYWYSIIVIKQIGKHVQQNSINLTHTGLDRCQFIGYSGL